MYGGAMSSFKKGSLLKKDRFLSPELLEKFPSMAPKIIIPGQYEQPLDRQSFINQFLKNWLTPKQMDGMAPWFTEMLDVYTTELLLHAQKVGIEKLLLQHKSDSFQKLLKDLKKESRKIALDIVPAKPKKMKVDLEEIPGGLETQARSVKLSDIKPEKPAETSVSLCDVVDHVG